ncbi:hypothetical protein [Streptacidiphilus albus]|uniref:hypothetical protein n=1 Tax=Streptacidiphilus albus TaxID=105425 RepID=UPI00128E689C|nr:hypothetical protein [Streptacidiphilus albus]
MAASGILGCGLFLPFAPQITLSHAYLPRHVGTASGATLGLSLSLSLSLALSLSLSLGGFLTPALGGPADSSSVRAVFVLIAALGLGGFLCSLFLTERQQHAAPAGAVAEDALTQRV